MKKTPEALKKSPRGGARPNSGPAPRPDAERTSNVTLCLTPEGKQWLTLKALKAGVRSGGAWVNLMARKAREKAGN